MAKARAGGDAAKMASATHGHTTAAHSHSADMAASEAADVPAAPAKMTAASAAMTTTESHRAGRHRRRADRDSSGERKNFLRMEVSPFDPRPPNDALGVAQSVSKMYGLCPRRN